MMIVNINNREDKRMLLKEKLFLTLALMLGMVLALIPIQSSASPVYHITSVYDKRYDVPVGSYLELKILTGPFAAVGGKFRVLPRASGNIDLEYWDTGGKSAVNPELNKIAYRRYNSHGLIFSGKIWGGPWSGSWAIDYGFRAFSPISGMLAAPARNTVPVIWRSDKLQATGVNPVAYIPDNGP
jgi:hypothetical protein